MRSNRILGALVLLAAVILLNLPLPAAWRVRAGIRDQVVSAETLLQVAAAHVAEALETVFRAHAAIDRRDALLDEIASLRQENRRLKLYEAENRELRRQLAFKEACDYDLLLATVVSRGGMGGWWQILRMNRGRADGVRENQAVIHLDGLVGRTVAVTARTADVLLLTDPQCRVACRLPRTDTLGIARGRGVTVGGRERLDVTPMARPFEVEYVDKDAAVREGDGVVTSGLGGVFPEGLLIGHVTKATMDDSGLFQRLTVRPTADLAELRYVWVVME